MHAIHNEQQDLTTSLSGKEVYDALIEDNNLTMETQQLLWKVAKLERTFFGEGFSEIAGISDGEDEEFIKNLNFVIKAFLTASLSYSTNPNKPALNILVECFIELGSEKNSLMNTEEDVYLFLMGLIECESLAAWLLVCEL